MANNQEQPVVPATDPGQAQAGQTSTGVPPELQQFTEPVPSNVPATDPGQAQVQGQAGVQGQTSDGVAELQRKLNERTVRSYQLEQDLQRERDERAALMRSFNPQGAQAQTQNPFDVQTQYPQWFQFEMDKRDERLSERVNEQFMNRLQGLSQQAQEFQFQQSHPEVSIQEIKAYARANGIADWNLDLAYRDMNRGAQLTQVAQQTAQSTIQQFRQPTVGAIPLRGQSAGGSEIALSYDRMAQAYQESNGEIAKTWSPELQAAFKQETYRRAAARRAS